MHIQTIKQNIHTIILKSTGKFKNLSMKFKTIRLFNDFIGLDIFRCTLHSNLPHIRINIWANVHFTVTYHISGLTFGLTSKYI
jgi:hypothetical protein